MQSKWYVNILLFNHLEMVFVVEYRKILSRSAIILSRFAYASVYCMKKNIHEQLSLPISRFCYYVHTNIKSTFV